MLRDPIFVLFCVDESNFFQKLITWQLVLREGDFFGDGQGTCSKG